MTKIKEQKSISSSIGNVFKSFDFYGETIGFNIKGAKSVKSVFGTIISLGIVAVVMAYGLNKFIVMINHEGSDF